MKLLVNEKNTGEGLLNMDYPGNLLGRVLNKALMDEVSEVIGTLVSMYLDDYAIEEINYEEWPQVITVTMKEENTMNTTVNPMNANLETMRTEQEEITMLSRAMNLQTKTAARDLIREMGIEVSNRSYKDVWRKESMIHVAIQCAKDYDNYGDESVNIIYQGYYNLASHGLDITQYLLKEVSFTEDPHNGDISASVASAPVEEKAQGMAMGDETTPRNIKDDHSFEKSLEVENTGVESTFTTNDDHSIEKSLNSNDHSFEESLEPTIDDLKAELAHISQVNQALARERDEYRARLQKGIKMYKDIKSEYTKLLDAYNKLKASQRLSHTVNNNHSIEKSSNNSQRLSETVTHNHSNRISSSQPKASTCSCGTEISYKNSKFSRKISSQYPPQYRDHDYCLYCQRALIALGKPLTKQDIIDGKHTHLPSVDMKAVLARVNKNTNTK